MSQFRLRPDQRHRLRELLHKTSDLNTYRRCLALLEVAAGRPVTEVADSLGVARQSVHNWIVRFEEAGGPEGLSDRYAGGHPASLGEDDIEALVALLGCSPRHFGSPAVNWTVPLLLEHLRRATGADVSEPTLRRELHRLGYVWKRPRYMLDPDPEREKKTPDRPQAALAAGHDRHPGRGRDRPAAAPAAAGRLGPARPAAAGADQRAERPAGDLRGPEPEDRPPPVAAPRAAAGRGLPGVPAARPRPLPAMAGGDAAR